MAFNHYTTKKARLEHQCSFCKMTIEPHEHYYAGYFKEHGPVKLCSECYARTDGDIWRPITFTTDWQDIAEKRRAFIPRPKQVKGAMRTFVARERHGNFPSLLIRTTSPSKATYLAFQEYEGDVPYVDIRVKREPCIDHIDHKEGVISDPMIMRSLGWSVFDEPAEWCEACGLCQWEGYPQTYVDSETQLCKECRDKGVTLNDTL